MPVRPDRKGQKKRLFDPGNWVQICVFVPRRYGL
jgi:hypothetical protein